MKNLMRPIFYGPNENYDFLTNIFIDFVSKHAPLKKKFIREINLHIWLETLGKKYIPEVGLEIDFVKTLQRKWKTVWKTRKTNALPLGENV